MAAPVFIQAGTGATDTAGAWTYTGAAPLASGNLLICQVVVDGVTAGTPTITSTTNIQSLSGTANQWTAATGNPYAIGSATSAGQLIFFARSTSTSAPVITGANVGGDDVYIRIYEFANVNTGTTLSDILENSTAGTISNGAGTGTTVSDTGVTTLGVDRMALQLVGLNDDVAIDAFTGETGGDWVEAVAEYAEPSGTDACLQLQMAYPGIQFLPIGSTALTFSGSGGAEESWAQSFASGAGGTVSSVIAKLYKDGSPTDDVVVEIQTDSAGAPSGSAVGSGSVSGTSLPLFTGVMTSFTVSATLSASTTYWLVFSRSGSRDTTNDYRVVFQSTPDDYAGGAAYRKDSGVWSLPLSTADISFAVLTGTGATINGGTDTIVTAGWGVVGFALIGTTVSAPAAPGSSFQTRRQRRASRYLTFR